MIDLRQPSWFVVEGPDGAGKSTLARSLAHLLSKGPCVLHKLDYDSKEAEYCARPGRWVTQGLHVVQDRGALSGPVYEPLFRRDMERLRWLEPLVGETARRGAKLLFVTAEIPVLEERVRRRGDDYVTPDSIKAIVEGYDEQLAAWQAAGGAFVMLDTTDDFPDELTLQLTAAALAVA